jgi:glycogen debranching enzyme
MHVIPQNDGSLFIKEPEKTAGFDMGNRSMFIKTNGKGDLNQIYFCKGAHAGSWKLSILIDGNPVSFQTAKAIGHLWALNHQSDLGQIESSVFIDDNSPCVFERLTFQAPPKQELNLKITLEVDITAPPAPKGKFKDIVARYLPRLPKYSWYWGWGMGRWLQTPAPKELFKYGKSGLGASGKVEWSLAANRQYSSLEIQKRNAVMEFLIQVPAGNKEILDFVLVDKDVLPADEAISHVSAALHDAIEYSKWLNRQINIEDPLLRSLYVSGLNASRSMFKEFPGGFNGLMAGADYAFPPRIYFRDSYWTMPALLDTAPELVREHLISLAAGVHPNGECASGVFAPHLLKEWQAPANCDADWLANHFDSPSFFILLLNDYLHKTQDWSLLKVIPPLLNPGLKWPARSIAEKAQAAIEYLISLDKDGDGLIEKPYLANDWADNIKRSTWVSYDQGLFIAALRAYASWDNQLHNSITEKYNLLADKALQGMYRELWDEELGYFVNYRRPGFTETNLSIDSLVVVYFNLLDEAHTQRLLDAVKSKLVASNNTEQPYGNYGLLCSYPPYKNNSDLFDKSASPYWYHNCADWPYWNGMMAKVLLQRHDPIGLEILLHWWKYSLDQGWLTPVEYYSPAFPVGGMLQGWSSMPAATLLQQLITVQEFINEKAAK